MTSEALKDRLPLVYILFQQVEQRCPPFSPGATYLERRKGGTFRAWPPGGSREQYRVPAQNSCFLGLTRREGRGWRVGVEKLLFLKENENRLWF